MRCVWNAKQKKVGMFQSAWGLNNDFGPAFVSLSILPSNSQAAGQIWIRG